MFKEGSVIFGLVKGLAAGVAETAVQAVDKAGKEARFRVESGLANVLSSAMETWANIDRPTKIKLRNSPHALRQRRAEAMQAMGPASQRQARTRFEDKPEWEMLKLEPPDLSAVEAAFHQQARLAPTDQFIYGIPLAEQTLGVIEYDKEDPRIGRLRRALGGNIEIYPKPLTDDKGQPVVVRDLVRPLNEAGDGMKLTGGPVSEMVEAPDGSLTPPAEYRGVMIPNVRGAVARRVLIDMTVALHEDPADPVVKSIIFRLDEIAEKTESYIRPDTLADIFSFRRSLKVTHPDIKGREVVDLWLKKKSDLSAHPSGSVLEKIKGGSGKRSWFDRFKKEEQIEVRRLKPRKS